MIVEIFILILSLLIGYFLYIHKKIHNYFEVRGVKYLPGVPIFGNIFKSTFLLKHALEDIDSVYRAFPGEKYVGFIEGTSKVILVRDPELIKKITVKDFEHFVDHKQFLPEEIEPIFTNSLLLLKGKKWHDMRTTLSPAFTGSKIKKMVPFIVEISSNIIEYLRDHVDEDVDVEDLIHRYANDVIASAAFGLHINSLKDKDNEFYTLGKSLFAFTGLQRFYFFLIAVFPNLCKKLDIHIFPERTSQFFRNLVTSTMEHREKNNIDRPDMIQLLMEASKGSLRAENDGNDHFSLEGDTFKPKTVKREWTEIELAGQLFIFFIAGYETSASTLVMCIHELAINPDVQEKLYQEIRKFKEEHGDITYDNVNSMKYLDCVLNETTRKWSAAIILDRECTKAYTLPPPREGGKPVEVNPGDEVHNVVNSIHMDPAHHPDPEKFDPERFSDENKHKIKPFTFMPFGVGPRNCIGSRLAILEMKVLLYYIVLNFKMVKCSKTTDPIELKPHAINIKSKGGSWIRLESRS